MDPTFYPVVYRLKDDEDWEDEENWYKVNPSLGYTVDIERLRDAYRKAKQDPADEVTFKWLRLKMWVSSTVAWIPDAIFMKGNEKIDLAALEGKIKKRLTALWLLSWRLTGASAIRRSRRGVFMMSEAC